MSHIICRIENTSGDRLTLQWSRNDDDRLPYSLSAAASDGLRRQAILARKKLRYLSESRLAADGAPDDFSPTTAGNWLKWAAKLTASSSWPTGASPAKSWTG